MRAFPTQFTTWADVPEAVASAMAPASDQARVQATVVARVGRLGARPHRGTLLWNEGADSVLAAEEEPFFALPGHAPRTAWDAPVLDENERVSGLLIATGGAHRATYWLPAASTADVRWTAVLDNLRHALDSTASISRDARSVRGRVRAIPVGDDIAFAQPVYAWKADGAPSLARIAILAGDSLMTGRTMIDATSLPGPVAAGNDTAGGATLRDFRARVASLYAAMRTALQHGDWAAFGRAYDALGALLASPPR